MYILDGFFILLSPSTSGRGQIVTSISICFQDAIHTLLTLCCPFPKYNTVVAFFPRLKVTSTHAAQVESLVVLVVRVHAATAFKRARWH